MPGKFLEPPFVWRRVYISKENDLAAVEDHKDRSEEAVWLCTRPQIKSGRQAHDSYVMPLDCQACYLELAGSRFWCGAD